MPDNRATVLREKIGLYRRYLANGIDSDLAVRYLREIKRMEAEFARLSNEGDPPAKK